MTSKVHRAVLSYLDAAATPTSIAIREYIEKGDYGSLLKMKVKPSDYDNAEKYLVDAQCLAFFSKNQDLPAKIDTRATALKAWWEAEHRCTQTNAFLSRVESGPHDRTTLRFSEFLLKVKKRVAWWLGPIPEELHGFFGPGVTACCRGKLSTVPDKMSVTPSTTASVLPYLKWWGESAWARSLDRRGLLYEAGEFRVDLMDHSIWSSVRKNAKTDRSIEIGPSLNVWYQLYVGKTMKRRFRRRGWDLLNSADLHRRVACEASISGSYATIDLKQASDSIAKILVRLCVPSEWFTLMNDLRTKKIKLPDGRVVHIAKFSGMGNGFTFELESVLFMAICQEILSDLGLPHTANRDVFVFGDDIIVPTEAAQPVINGLRCLGFETNEDKTFISGKFRESCGGDFFEGVAVRPHFLEEDPSEPQQLISFANGLRRVACSHPRGFHVRSDFVKPWFRVLDTIPKAIRDCRGPEDLGDIVIHDDASTWHTKTRNSIRWLRVYRPVVRQITTRRGGSWVGWEEFGDEVRLAHRLYHNDNGIGVLPRNSVEGYKVGWVPRS